MTYEQFKTYLSDNEINLNSQQEEAMRVTSGPTILLAVPGSGKTTTMIARIGYMIHCNRINPESILTITYTKASAGDMRRRFSSIFGDDFANVEFRTINSLCLWIINEYAKITGERIPRLESDATATVRRLFQDVYGEYPVEGDIKESMRVIAYIKNMQLDNEAARKLRIGEHDARELYLAYCNYMNRSGRMDFDDQLVFAYEVLKNDNAMLQLVQNRFRYILVDEAQDTSKIQHEIIALIAARHKNIFMVGDEDQSIYGFRAAYPKALLDFANRYPGAKVLKLEQNYRSTKQIVKSAKNFIEHNSSRLPKEMFTERQEGGNIEYISLENRYRQYRWLVDRLKNESDETAVLYRNNDSAIPLIYYLKGAGVRFRTRGVDTAFFTHKVVNDIRLFFDFAENPSDPELFMKIYYKVDLRIRKIDAQETVRKFDSQIDEGLFHAYRRLFATGGMASRVQRVINEFDNLRRDSAWEAIGRIQYKLRKFTNEEKEKFVILKVLAACGETRSHYLNKLSWLKDIINEGVNDAGSSLMLSTVHSSKGLEYEHVYIIDAIDGIMPAPHDDRDADTLEEERRIFYVAMTRAKDKLTIIRYANEDMPFVDLIQTNRRPNQTGTLPAVTRTAAQRLDAGQRPVRRQRNTVNNADQYFAVGDRVKHSSKGTGTVTLVEGMKIEVKFDSGDKVKYGAQVCVENDILNKV